MFVLVKSQPFSDSYVFEIFSRFRSITTINTKFSLGRIINTNIFKILFKLLLIRRGFVNFFFQNCFKESQSLVSDCYMYLQDSLHINIFSCCSFAPILVKLICQSFSLLRCQLCQMHSISLIALYPLRLSQTFTNFDAFYINNMNLST